MIIVSSRKRFLFELSKFLQKESVGAEIGVLNGGFSKHILDIIQPYSLTLIDPYKIGTETYDDNTNTAYSTEDDYQNLIKLFYDEVMAGSVKVIRKYSYDAANDVEDNSCDWIYIDASHLYKDVKRDLNDWLPKLKSNGVCAGHDYIDLYGFGVIEAVNEFCEEKGFEIILLNSNGGDFALQKINK